MDRVKELINVLEDESDPQEQATAALTLGEIGDERALKPLVKYMKTSQDKFVRRDCAEALGLLESEKAVDDLIETMMTDPFRYARNEAAESLGHIGDKKAIPYLLAFMEKEDWEFGRASAALALAEIGDAEIIPDIMRAIRKETTFAVIRDMVKALDRFRELQTVGLISEMLLQHENWEVRLQCAKNLGRLMSKSSVRALVSALKDDPHLNVRREAEASLRMLAGDLRVTWVSAEQFLDKIELMKLPD